MSRYQRCGVFMVLYCMTSSHIVHANEWPDRPNIVWIMADDLGYGDLGCYGQERIETPNLDQLAAEGMRFTSFYSGSTVCRPSRLTLWTGRHTGQTPISSNASYVFQPKDVTVAEALGTVGYAVGGVGKWAMGRVDTVGRPTINGFDFWLGYLDQGAAHNYYPTHLWRNESRVPLAGNTLSTHPDARGRVAVERVTYSHDVIMDGAIEFIEANRDRPFVFHAHWTLPHANNEGGRVTGDGMEIPDYGIYADRDWPNVEKGHAAMVTRVDHDVGLIRSTLERLEIAERTLLVFVSDNGPHSEGGHRHEFFDSNGPLRGYKRDLYEGGIRIPAIAWWPGVIEAGAVSAEPIGFWDYFATVGELTGAPVPRDTNGTSFAPTLLGEGRETPEYLFWEYRDRVAIRAGRWKGVRPGADAALELYDLDSDESESVDLAGRRPAVVQRLNRWIAEANAAESAAQ